MCYKNNWNVVQEKHNDQAINEHGLVLSDKLATLNICELWIVNCERYHHKLISLKFYIY